MTVQNAISLNHAQTAFPVFISTMLHRLLATYVFCGVCNIRLQCKRWATLMRLQAI